MQKSSYEIKIYGKVQGVYFRAYTSEVADKLSIKGYVKNMDDGSVYILAQGELTNIEKLIDWCKKGSPRAEVSEVSSQKVDSNEQFTEFRIRH